MKRVLIVCATRQAGGDTDMSRDYEYTDWHQVEACAGRLSAHLTRGPFAAAPPRH